MYLASRVRVVSTDSRLDQRQAPELINGRMIIYPFNAEYNQRS
jgi:hypothetical protein